MTSLAALTSGTPPGAGGHAQSAAGYLGAAVLRGLLAMSVSRSLDLEEKEEAEQEKGPLDRVGHCSERGSPRHGTLSGGCFSRKHHPVTRTKSSFAKTSHH